MTLRYLHFFRAIVVCIFFFFFFMILRPPRSTLFPSRRSSDLALRRSIKRECRAPELAYLYSFYAFLYGLRRIQGDRKSTRLNSSHVEISYAVFCLKKKKKMPNEHLSKSKNPTSAP